MTLKLGRAAETHRMTTVRNDIGGLVHESTFVKVYVRLGVMTIVPAGPQVGQREGPIITDEVNKQLAAAGKSLRFVVVDLAQVTFMSSMGLGAVIGFRNEAHRLGAKCILVNVNADLIGVLKMMKIDRLYTIAKDQAEVVKLTS